MRYIWNLFVVKIIFKLCTNSRNRKTVNYNHGIENNLSKSISRYLITKVPPSKKLYPLMNYFKLS